jgi:hypothetical protein
VCHTAKLLYCICVANLQKLSENTNNSAKINLSNHWQSTIIENYWRIRETIHSPVHTANKIYKSTKSPEIQQN